MLTRFKKFREMLKKPMLTIFVIMSLCSIIEYITSWYLEQTKGLRYWDYTGNFLNINGRICLECSIFLGLGGSLCVYIVVPFLERMIQKINTKTKIVICTILLSLIVIDNIYSSKNPNVGEGITETVYQIE